MRLERVEMEPGRPEGRRTQAFGGTRAPREQRRDRDGEEVEGGHSEPWVGAWHGEVVRRGRRRDENAAGAGSAAVAAHGPARKPGSNDERGAGCVLFPGVSGLNVRGGRGAKGYGMRCGNEDAESGSAANVWRQWRAKRVHCTPGLGVSGVETLGPGVRARALSGVQRWTCRRPVDR